MLKDQIDITRVPFSNRGSRLLVFQHKDQNSLFVKLAERLICIEPGIESYLKRPPFIDNFIFVDGSGKSLEFKAFASPDILRFQTQLGTFELVFQNNYTLRLGIPDHKASGLRFRVRTTHSHITSTGGAIDHVRNFRYNVHNGSVIKNSRYNNENECWVEIISQAEKDCSIVLQISDNPDISIEEVPFSAAKKTAREHWERWYVSVPDVDEKYRQKYAYAWWVMANNLIDPSGHVRYEAMMPTKAFYVGIWLWDSALHAIALRHIDPELARNQIRVMLAHQLPNGMLPDVVFDEGIVAEIDHPIHGFVTKPPILAWSALKIHETAPDIDFLKEIYEPLKRWNRWWFAFNDDDKDGIVQYTHPYSSGLDDSPLWDYGMPIESPDINTYLYIQMDSLATIADIIGKDGEAITWRDEAKSLLGKMIDHLWDEESGIFHAWHDEKPLPVLTPFNLYPLWTGDLPQRITDRLLLHLQDENKFWGKFGIPTVAFNDSAFNPDKMWRGPVWANINYFFIDALQKIGEDQLAIDLCNKTLNLIASHPDIREYYNSLNGEPPTTAAPTFGWSAAVFIDLLLTKNKTRNPIK